MKLRSRLFTFLVISLILIFVFFIDAQSQDTNPRNTHSTPNPDSTDPQSSNHRTPNPDSGVSSNGDHRTPNPDSSESKSSRRSRSGRSTSNLFINITPNKYEAIRGDCLSLFFNITSINAKSSGIILDFKIPLCLNNITTIIDGVYNNCKDNHVLIKRPNLDKGASFNFSILANISLDADLKMPIILNNSIISSSDWVGKSDPPSISNLSVKILNHNPEIEWVELEIISPSIYRDGILTLIDPSNPYSLRLNSSFKDLEDLGLTYKLQAHGSNICISNYTTGRPFEEIININNFKTNTIYSFSFSVIDNDLSETNWSEKVDLRYKNNHSPFIFIPDWKSTWIQFLDIIFSISIISIVSVLVVVFLFNYDSLIPFLNIQNIKLKLHELIENVIEARKRLTLIDIIYPIVVICLICFYWHSYREPSGDYFYKSRSFYLMIIYLIGFSTYVYLTRRFFDLIEEEKHIKLLIINGIFMAILLWSIVFVISNVEPTDLEEHIRSYYATMGEIFATILAIVAAFFSGMPKNILDISKGDDNPRVLYPYQAMLYRFVVVYGSILALSLSGLSAGTYINFNPYITWDINNLVFTSIFFITLMLIPPAITCLHELLKLIIHTSNVIIKSNPDGAIIHIAKIGSKNVKIDTRLTTPNTIIFKKFNALNRHETITIELIKRGYISEQFDIEIQEGVQNEYNFSLSLNPDMRFSHCWAGLRLLE